MPSIRNLVPLLLAVGSFAGLASSANCSVNAPLAPSEDPWYTEPAGFESSPPGSVLRVREAPGNLTALFNGSASAWNILYRTTDSQYRPTFAVTTLFVPSKPNKKALMSYQIPYDSADVDASPSFAMTVPNGAIGSEAVIPALAQGWFVSVPGYEGPLASFTAGVLSGHATIDSVRAVRNLHARFGLDKDAKYTMWGYSGGALASEWAAELQIQYAPEMKFAGAALGGLTPNVTSVLLSINGKEAAGLGASAILGLGSQYPAILQKYVSKLKKSGPYNATGFLAAKKMSLAEAGISFANQDLSKYFDNGFSDILNNETDPIVYSDGIMGYHGVPRIPLYVYKATHDEISPVKDTDDLVAKYCNMGADIEYVRNTIGNHEEEGTTGATAAFLWLVGLYSNATTVKKGCSTQTEANNGTSMLRRDAPVFEKRWLWRR